MVYLLFTKITKAAFALRVVGDAADDGFIPPPALFPIFARSAPAAVFGLSHNNYLLYRMPENENALQNNAHTRV